MIFAGVISKEIRNWLEAATKIPPIVGTIEGFYREVAE
jgi:hypothetical protein